MPTNTNTTDVAIDIDLPAIAAAADLAEEEDIEAINGARARQGTPFVIKCGVVMACVAFGALIIGVSSFLLAGPPTTTMNSSSKQVAINTSGEIEIDGFTKVGDGACLDGSSQRYDLVYFGGVANAQACANICSVCPGGGQPDSDGDTLLLRGFFWLGSVCDCYVENSAGFPEGLCDDECAIITKDSNGNGGTGEIKKTAGVGEGECWKVNSKSSKSPKRG